MASKLYEHAMYLFEIKKPIIAAVQGAAVGGGLGLAVAADFRVSCQSAKFSANFSRLGISPGFGLSDTLPRLVGIQNASLMFYTGKRFNGGDAFRVGLVDELVAKEQVKMRARSLAKEITISSPKIVQKMKKDINDGEVAKIRKANKIELMKQSKEMREPEFIEGLVASHERREPSF